MAKLSKYGGLSDEGVGKILSAFQTTKTYEITFSDLVSKCDEMQKWRRKQKTGKWPQVLIDHILPRQKKMYTVFVSVWLWLNVSRTAIIKSLHLVSETMFPLTLKAVWPDSCQPDVSGMTPQVSIQKDV